MYPKFLLLPIRAWASLFTAFTADHETPKGGGGDGDHVGGGRQGVGEGSLDNDTFTLRARLLFAREGSEGAEAGGRNKVVQGRRIKIRTPRLRGWGILRILGSRLTFLQV